MDNNELIYKIWLSQQLKNDAFKFDKLMAHFDSAENVYNFSAFDKNKIKKLGILSIFEFNDKSLDPAKRIVEQCNVLGIRLVSMDDPEYPQRLRQIKGHPPVLYVKGKLPDIENMVGIGMVGSRECTGYGLKMSEQLAYDLASCGCLIISGMALGIDGAAHKGALNANKPTVAVLGGGVDVVYPSKNTDLYKFIQNDGAVISEYPPGTRPERHHFPVRNRIISGLSMGVIIVECSAKSGALHTARHANDQGRDIFAVPGNIDLMTSAGSNNLIKDGAIMVTSAEDVLGEYLQLYPQMLANNIQSYPKRSYNSQNNRSHGQTAVVQEKATIPKSVTAFTDIEKYKNLNENEKKIIKYLYNKPPVHIDEISRAAGMDAKDINSAIVLLQMKGLISQKAGNLYELK